MIVSFPGAERSSEVVLHETLEQKPQNVLLIFQREDGTWEADCSHMPVGFMCHALTQLDEEVRHKLFRSHDRNLT